MSDLRDLSAFTVPLALAAHHRAKGLQRHHAAPAVQKRVYLNTLAVYAVETYLETLGYDLDQEDRYSDDPAQQVLRDVADLSVAAVGRLECRPVLPGETVMTVPAEAVGDRLGYIGVQLDASLRQATLLGFVDTLPALTGNALTIPLAELRPLEDLGNYLEPSAATSGLEPGAAAPNPIRLSRWLQQATEAGWQALSDTLAALAAPTPTLAFRSSPPSAETPAQPVPTIGQTKLVRLGQGPEAVTVNLLVGLIPQAQDDIEIWVQISPTGDRDRLPSALRLQVLDVSDAVVMQAEARGTEAIQLKFVAAVGERFSVQVALGDRTHTEVFGV